MKALKPCGTRAAYERHRSNGEDACGLCLKANADRGREERAAYSRARSRARHALKRLHPERGDALYAEEVRREPLPDRKAKSRARQRALASLVKEFPQDWGPLFAAELATEQHRAGG